MSDTHPEPGARIDIPSVPNLRDIGGYVTADGHRVRTGLLYRSAELDHLRGQDADIARFEELGIRTVVDLRTEAERTAAPDFVPDGVTDLICDVLADDAGAGPAQLLKVISDPAAAEEMLGGGRAVEMFEGGYRDIVSLASALRGYRTMFETIVDEGALPLLFHCTTGKDRTGWAAASTLLLLGVAEETVLAEYELTNRDLIPALKPVFEQFRAAGGDPELLRPVLGVDAAYLAAALAEMRDRFGTIEGYFADGLGIVEDGQAALRGALLET